MKKDTRFMRVSFKGNNYDKLKAISEQKGLSLHVYVSKILDDYLAKKYFPRGYKKGGK